MQQHSSQAARLLTSAQQGIAPDRRVEQLHLLQLFLRLHRQAHERTGEEPSAVARSVRKSEAAHFPTKKCRGPFCIARAL